MSLSMSLFPLSFRLPRSVLMLTEVFLLVLMGGGAGWAQEKWSSPQPIVFKRYNLSCLAPLLENLNEDAPKSLSEAFLRGPTGLLAPLPEEGAATGDGTGALAVHFTITTEKPEAQSYFNRGIALLHTMAYRDSERAFRSVVQVDPGCAMGYWGLAAANELSPGRARLFARTAVNKTSVNRPQLEQRWIDILAAYYGVTQEEQTRGGSGGEAESLAVRSAARIRALENLVIDFPEEVEPKAFLLRQLTLDRYRAGIEINSYLGVERLAVDLAERAPKHPSRHYSIFLWLERRPERGLLFADVAPELSPAVAEVWRYAGEAYAEAGRIQEAILMYEAAIRVDHRLMEDGKLMPWETQNLAANYEILITTLAGMGRTEEALLWAGRAARLPGAAGSVSVTSSGGGVPSLARRLGFEALAEAGRWQLLLDQIESAKHLKSKGNFEDEAVQLFWQGIAQLFLDHPEEATACSEDLQEVLGRALKTGVSNEVEATISAAIKSLKTSRNYLELEDPQPLQAADPPSFLEPLLVMQLNEKAGLSQHAAMIARERAAAWPDALLRAATYCDFAYKTGNRRDAFFQMNRRLRGNASVADADLPLFSRLDAVAAEMQLPTPWTLPMKAVRPPSFPEDPEVLGPVAWTPPAAPDFSLPDYKGRKVSLDDFKGQPVLLNFFLGVTCPFCVEQLNLFKPQLSAFREGGIEFVAVSTDPAAILQQRFREGDGAPGVPEADFPFMVLADPGLDTFKAFRAFDDFEGGPLHATILLDGEGRVLWADRGHAPFKFPEALLSESRRLLEIHGAEEE